MLQVQTKITIDITDTKVASMPRIIFQSSISQTCD